MLEEIFEELKAELLETEGDKFNETLLRSKIKSAYRSIQSAAELYTEEMSEASIEREMEKYYSNVYELSLYRYNKVGAEGLTQYSQDGVSQHYEDEKELYHGVRPYVKIVG